MENGEVFEPRDIPARRAQVEELLSILGEPEQETYPSIFIYGNSSTGKTYAVKALLKHLEVCHAYVSCLETFQMNQFYASILNRLSSHSLNSENDFTNYARCDNMNTFVRHVRDIIEERRINGETVYIVLDKAERLRHLDSKILAAFLRLRELTGKKICTILISEITWDKFRPKGYGIIDPCIVHFPQYTKDQVSKILCRGAPPEVPSDFYADFVRLILDVFYAVCRDLLELRSLVEVHYDKYEEPVRQHRFEYGDRIRLWRNVQPILKDAMKTVYLRQVSGSKWRKMITETSTNEDSIYRLMPSSTKDYKSWCNQQVELPLFTKYLLLASYLASYNPSKTDKRFFVKLSGKSKGRMKKKDEKANRQLLGPAQFPLHRMITIFDSITAEEKTHERPSQLSILSQVQSLVTLRYLQQVSADGNLLVPRYKCLANLELVLAIAESVKFEIRHYLYDFCQKGI